MNIILKISLYFFLLLFASFSLQAEESSTPTQADDEQNKPVKKQYYIVEVILFRHLNEQGKLDEFWNKPGFFDESLDSHYGSNQLTNNASTINPVNASQNVLTDDIPALAEYDLQSKHFSPLRNGIAKLSAENYKLADSAAHLRYSPNYKLLAHFGWTQRSLSKRQALPIRIISHQFSDSLIPDGEIKLYVSRYLHMLVDLSASQCEYTEKQIEGVSDKTLDEQLESGMSKQEIQAEMEKSNIASNNMADSNQCINKVYQFKQNRKMRSRELHYIDNPVFGLLVYVTPLSVTKEETNEASASK